MSTPVKIENENVSMYILGGKASISKIEYENISMHCLETNVQPQPCLDYVEIYNPNNIVWDTRVPESNVKVINIKVVEEKGLVISLHVQALEDQKFSSKAEKEDDSECVFPPKREHKPEFIIPKDSILKVEMSTWWNNQGLSMAISHKDPQEIVPCFVTILSSLHEYSVKTLRKGIEKGLGIKVEEPQQSALEDQMPF